MTDIEKEYFDWLKSFVYDTKYIQNEELSYKKLFYHLHSVSFIVVNPYDENRMYDGIDLRYRFGRERNYPDSLIASELDNKEASVFEVMISLAIRCEDAIMVDDREGNRTGQWFWNMILSLGLNHMTDGSYDPDYIDNVLSIFLNRLYEPNGKGGLFTLNDPYEDMSKIEIWYQMHMYLNEVAPVKDFRLF